jgi:NB-ARC domain
MEDNTLAPCVNWQKKLAALHPDDLSPAERADLDAHMVDCPKCTAAFDDYNKMDRLIREMFVCEKPLEIPEWLTQEDLPRKLSALPVPYHNLPPRLNHFLGRQEDLTRVLEGLSYLHPLLVIKGESGIGKTTFALEVAYQCLEGSDLIPHPLFDAAVWISASGRWNRDRWLSEVLNTIAYVLDRRFIAQLSLQEKRIKVDELLCTHQTLVIIDDFDTVDDDALLSWIQQIPEPSKVLVTSHETHQFYQEWTLHLAGLMEYDALSLISHYVQKLDLSVLGRAETYDLFHITHGNPQAIAITLGNVKSSGLSLHQILDELRSAKDVLDHLLIRSWSTLESFPDTQRILLATSFFEGSASEEALAKIAETDETRLEKALRLLMELSLIEVYSDRGGRPVQYGLHPMIRAFADIKLKEELDWEQQARERWIDWWLTFTKVHGGPDGMEWAEHYSLIDEERVNLSLVCEWCVAHDRYETLQAFWHSERLLWMTSVYGCWKLRLTWLRRIGNAAERRGDRATALEAMVEQGFTLTQIERVKEAGEMLKEAWRQKHFLSLRVQATLAENLVQWHMRINNFAGALHWLKEADRLVRNLSELEERTRHTLTIQYYSGVMCIAKGDKQRAEVYFNETLKGAQEIGWQRCMIYVEQFLADIAKVPPDEPKDLPKAGMTIVDKHRLHVTYSGHSLVRFALSRWKQNNKMNEVRDWAQQALNSFERLEVQPEVMEQLGASPPFPSVVCFISTSDK